MSTTEIYVIQKKGDVVAYHSARNSWLGGMHVWRTLNEKYGFNDGMYGFEKTWGSFNKGVYEEYEDVVLGSTFDNVIILKKDFDALISSFEKYFKVYPNCNFDQQIEIFKRMKDDENIIGVAWCQTSVVNDVWDYFYDERSDETIPYNIFKGDKHWELFKDLEESK